VSLPEGEPNICSNAAGFPCHEKENEIVSTTQAEQEAAQPEQAAAEQVEQPRRRGRPPASSAKKTRTVELTLTVTGTAEGEWQAELTQAGKRVVQGLAIPAAAVARAATELHEDIAKAIDTVLDQARQQHRARMEELEAELEKVRSALAELQEG
jgi:polyhydroxyalkanoate synthesis regulator phasin